MKNESTAVIIGRWQIPHKGHETLINEALKYDNVVIVVGSSHKARSVKNPFNFNERIDMLTLLIPEAKRASVKFLPMRDFGDDVRWNTAIKAGVENLFPDTTPVLVGYEKDHTSYYLNYFRNWKTVMVTKEHDIDATNLRKLLFESNDLKIALNLMKHYVSEPVINYLQAWSLTPVFKERKDEHLDINDYREKYPAPFYITGDAVVTASDHILLITRKSKFGREQWALPGSFLKGREKGVDTAIRSLREKAGLGILDDILRSSIKEVTTFDSPDRSPRGRIITIVPRFELGDVKKLPELGSSDKGIHAFWLPISEIVANESKFFEDHSLIIDHYLKIFK